MTPAGPCMTFDPIDALHFSRGFLIPNFGSLRAFLSNLTSSWPLHDLWPHQSNKFLPRVLPIKFGCHRAFLSILTPDWQPYMTWPQECITLWSGALPAKFGDHRSFVKQFDLWVTFDLWSGGFEKLTTNLGGPFPTTLSSFSSMHWSTKKRIAGQTQKLTDKVVVVVVVVIVVVFIIIILFHFIINYYW